MHTGTMKIVPETTVEELRLKKNPSANFFKKIPREFEKALLEMSRAQRRRWYKENKKLLLQHTPEA